MYKGLILSLELEAVKNNSWRRTKARKAWLPDRGEHEHLVHHLDVEELVHHLDVEELRHDELLRLDEQLPHDATEGLRRTRTDPPRRTAPPP